MNTKELNEMVVEMDSIIKGTYRAKPLDIKSALLQAELNDSMWLHSQVSEIEIKLDKFTALISNKNNIK